MLTAPPFVAHLDAPTPCRARPQLFDPEASRADRTTARTLCAACPARADCGQHALTTPTETGVWGGTTDDDRRRTRAAAARAAGRPVAPADRRVCGTPEAYQRHRRHGETCPECAVAERGRQVDRLAAAHRAAATGRDTGWAYHLERRLGLPHCEPCREWCRANSARKRARARAQRAASLPDAPVVRLRPNDRQTAAQRFEPAA